MTTYYRLDIRTLCRRRMGDLTTPYKWSDEQLNQWINDAIADYTMHFPRVQTQTISCSDDTRNYDLSTYFLDALCVEYPVGEDPPVYLLFRENTHPDFWQEDGYYYIEKEKGADDLNLIYISEKPATGESIEVTFNAHHAFLDDDDAYENTVPERHLELIILFVRWAAYQELAITENASPDPTSSISSTLELNANRAGESYSRMLNSFIKTETNSARAVWKMDDYDRIC